MNLAIGASIDSKTAEIAKELKLIDNVKLSPKVTACDNELNVTDTLAHWSVLAPVDDLYQNSDFEISIFLKRIEKTRKLANRFDSLLPEGKGYSLFYWLN